MVSLAAMCHWLSAEQATSHAHLTTPALGKVLGTVTVPSVHDGIVNGLHAAAMCFAGLPAALAVLQRTAGESISIVSLAVAEPFRRLGLARQLLTWLTSEASRLGCSSLVVSYPLNHASTVAMQRLTDPARGWQHGPGLRLVHCDRAAGASIVTRLSPLADRWQSRERWTLLPWRLLRPEQILLMNTLQQQAPHWACPHTEYETELLGQRDQTVSQVLFDRGDVVGWLVAHRIGLSLCRVTQWWVHQRLQGRGVGLLLLHHAIVAALAAEPQYLSGCFGIASKSHSMRLISAAFLEPLASGVQESQRSFLRLQ